MILNDGLVIVCLVIPGLISLVCLGALCFALSKFVTKNEGQMPDPSTVEIPKCGTEQNRQTKFLETAL